MQARLVKARGARPCVRSGGGVDGTRRARPWPVRWSIGVVRAAVRSRRPCGRCGAECLAAPAIAAGSDSHSPCRRGACRACVGGGRGGSGSGVCPSPAGPGPGCRARSRRRFRRTGADRSARSLRALSSSRTRRRSSAHTLTFIHAVNRRWAIARMARMTPQAPPAGTTPTIRREPTVPQSAPQRTADPAK